MGNWYTDDVKYIAGVGEARAKLLDKELGIATVGDLLYHFPFRYIDRTKIYRIAEIGASGQTLVQFRGRVTGVAYAGEGKIKKVAANTYIITPYHVELEGDLIDELESNGLYF